MGVKLIGILPRGTSIMFHGNFMLLSHPLHPPLFYNINCDSTSDTIEQVIKSWTRQVNDNNKIKSSTEIETREE